MAIRSNSYFGMASLIQFCCFVFCSTFLCVLYLKTVMSVLQSLRPPADKVIVRTLDDETQQSLSKLFRGNPGYARFGEGGHLMHSFLRWHVGDLKTMQVRPDDVWVVTYPRSGFQKESGSYAKLWLGNIHKMGDKMKVRALDAENQETLIKLFKGYPDGFARFGEGGYLMPTFYDKNADNLKNVPVRSDDVWVVTYPRSGTTWTQDLVWLLMNDHDYETALKIPLMSRYFFIEVTSMYCEDLIANFTKGQVPEEKLPSLYEISVAPSPRFMKTHLPLSLLPDNLLDTTKVVYVARDPRDVAVSFYHHSRLFKTVDYLGDFKTFWNLFIKDLITWTPFFSHLKEAWAHRDHPNMLFIFYEELQQNLPASIERIAKFLGKEVTSEQIQRLCEHLNINNFKNNESVNPPWIQKIGNPDAEGFIRKGKSGGWREYFDEGMAAQAQRWLRAQLSDTDLRFPDTGSTK